MQGPDLWLSDLQATANDGGRINYLTALALGVAREQARQDLPLSTYTELYWKVDLHNLLHFLSLRMDSHAQKEIRDFANAIASVVKEWVPHVWEAFEDYRLGGASFSRMELAAMRALINHDHGRKLSMDEIITGPPMFSMTREENEVFEREHEARWNGPFKDWHEHWKESFLKYHGLTNKRERDEFLKKLGLA